MLPLSNSQLAIIKQLSKTYIWWQTPDEAVKNPYRVIAQVMELGTAEDTQLLYKSVGKGVFKDVLDHAIAGWFTPKSWNFWHIICRTDEEQQQNIFNVPPLPKRNLPNVL
ncbi:hypothetical protein [Pelistega ratti]|uniref:hypothetical protein n=1 Tax=Pelistega ratti TaxID=2652177 RepID=UPI001359B386|nr:hypothetical protein [Pelistega ratti]